MTSPATPPQGDPALSALLQSWTCEAEAPASLREGVWLRLDTRGLRPGAEPGVWASVAHGIGLWLENQLRRPWLVTAGVALLLLVGFGAGAARGKASSLALTASLQGRYIQSIDPFSGFASPPDTWTR